jgi:hypothetical protein
MQNAPCQREKIKSINSWIILLATGGLLLAGAVPALAAPGSYGKAASSQTKRRTGRAQPAAAASAGEGTYWESIRDNKDPADSQAYLAKFGEHGYYGALAHNRLNQLGAPDGTPVSADPGGVATARIPGNPLVIDSADGVSQLTVPDGWHTAENLNNSATIQASYPAQNLYGIVITDIKANMTDSVTLATYARDRLGKLTESLTNITITGPQAITVNGKPGLMYEVHGEISNLKAAYLFAVVETDLHFHQIGVWTLETEFAAKRSTMLGVVESLREK